MEEYNNMQNKELEKKSKELESEFNECKFLVKQTIERMNILSEEYGKIQTILKQRNGNNAK